MLSEAQLNPAELLGQKTRTARLNEQFWKLPTPAFVFDELLLEDNLRYLKQLQAALGIKIIFAQKSYSFYATYPLISRYLPGTTSSGLYEARLAKEEFPGEIHVFSPGYTEKEMTELVEFADHIYFNSFDQWQRFKGLIERAGGRGRKIKVALRINPEFSRTERDIYNPAGPYSRLGISLSEFKKGVARYGLKGVNGLHFHALCEENAEPLAEIVDLFRRNFAPYLKQMSWVNFGGGHHLTRSDYRVDILAKTIQDYRTQYPDQEIYLEPGEAISLDTGFMVTEVLATGKNQVNFAILDSSASCHMPDILEVPYRPRAFLLDENYQENGYYLEAEGVDDRGLDNCFDDPKLFRLGGASCLAGDIIGNYIFPRPLRLGDRLAFADMALYAHVKTNSFNGMPLPALVRFDRNNQVIIEREFSYRDFKSKLGKFDV